MAQEHGRLARGDTRQLLYRILDQENLVAAVQALPAQALGKLIRHVGLEDAGELVGLASTEQLKGIFDEDLWHSERPGQDESFDAGRFALWLEVMLEAGEAFAAQKLAELPEDLVTLALHAHVLVIDIEALAITMSSRASEYPDDDDARLEKALESCLAEELGEFRIVSRRHESWDTLFGLLVALDRDHHDFLQRLLERLAALDAELVEDSGGLFRVLGAAESLAADAAAEREDRRAEQGYVAPSSAAAFLALARATKTEAVAVAADRDPITAAYFRQLGRTPTVKRATAGAAPEAGPSPLVELLREAEVLPVAPGTHRLEAASGPGERKHRDPAAYAEPLTGCLRQLAQDEPETHAARMSELAYLGNVLVAGCSLARRSMRPVEAASAALCACNLGLTSLAGQPGKAKLSSRSLLARTPADRLFGLGWALLFHDVLCAAVAVAEDHMTYAMEAQANPSEVGRALKALRSARASGKPWLALPGLHVLDETLAAPALTALCALVDECPSMAGELAPELDPKSDPGLVSGPVFIATPAQVERVRAFLAGLRPSRRSPAR